MKKLNIFVLTSIFFNLFILSFSDNESKNPIEKKLTNRNYIFTIPLDYPTIQEGINIAPDGTEIIVLNGFYGGGIDFKGKNINLHSEHPDKPELYIIYGYEKSPVVTFSGTEGETCTLAGFTLKKGKNINGGGILGNKTKATIKNNIIIENSATNDGGGIYECNGLVANNLIFNNSSGRYGGGVCGLDGIIENNIILSNNSFSDGGGVYNCLGNLRNNNILKNFSETGSGGGLANCYASARIVNNIIWGNGAISTPQIYNSNTYYYCCIEGLESSGNGNISLNPNFENYLDDNFHLTANSPCIDAGIDTDVPKIDFEGKPRPVDIIDIDNNGALEEYDIGAYEFLLPIIITPTPEPTPTASPIVTPTPSPISTSTPTPTITPINTQIPSPTPTNQPTLTPTPTISTSPTPSNTPTPTITPSLTPTPMPSPTPYSGLIYPIIFEPYDEQGEWICWEGSVKPAPETIGKWENGKIICKWNTHPMPPPGIFQWLKWNTSHTGVDYCIPYFSDSIFILRTRMAASSDLFAPQIRIRAHSGDHAYASMGLYGADYSKNDQNGAVNSVNTDFYMIWQPQTTDSNSFFAVDIYSAVPYLGEIAVDEIAIYRIPIPNTLSTEAEITNFQDWNKIGDNILISSDKITLADTKSWSSAAAFIKFAKPVEKDNIYRFKYFINRGDDRGDTDQIRLRIADTYNCAYNSNTVFIDNFAKFDNLTAAPKEYIHYHWALNKRSDDPEGDLTACLDTIHFADNASTISLTKIIVEKITIPPLAH